MVWRDQDPPATDVLLDFTMPFSGGGSPAYLELEKLPDGWYRATVGTLFECQELCRMPSRKWLEFEGGVISGLFNQPGPALERRGRSRHDDG